MLILPPATSPVDFVATKVALFSVASPLLLLEAIDKSPEDASNLLLEI